MNLEINKNIRKTILSDKIKEIMRYKSWNIKSAGIQSDITEKDSYFDSYDIGQRRTKATADDRIWRINK